MAAWAFRNRKDAGRFTDTLPAAEGFYLPLLAGDNCVGAMGVQAAARRRRCPSTSATCSRAFATQIALALDRERLRAAEEAARLSRGVGETAPHAARRRVARDEDAARGDRLGRGEPRRTAPLVAEIRTATRRLQRLVNNLLDMTRLESGTLRLRRDWCDPADLINAAREMTADALRRPDRADGAARRPSAGARRRRPHPAGAGQPHPQRLRAHAAGGRDHARRRRRRGGGPGLARGGRQRTRAARRASWTGCSTNSSAAIRAGRAGSAWGFPSRAVSSRRTAGASRRATSPAAARALRSSFPWSGLLACPPNERRHLPRPKSSSSTTRCRSAACCA